MRKCGDLKKEEEGGSKQISVLPGRPLAKVCLKLEGRRKGRATA